MSTWKNDVFPGRGRGFLTAKGGGQTEASWLIRSHPNVINAFKNIWKTESDPDPALLTSMDTMICWRNWESEKRGDESWDPVVERLHCDQSPALRKGKHCVQGMIPLYPVTKEVGGLQVVPKTNTDANQEALVKRYGETGDWLELRQDDELIGTGQLLIADPGDLILWDSRTIHGGYIGKGPLPKEDRLLRLSMTVTMTPFSKWDKEKNANLLEKRMWAVNKGCTTTHWPFEYNSHSGWAGGNYKPPVMDETRLKLVRGPEPILNWPGKWYTKTPVFEKDFVRKVA